ncbi:MAG: long-chain fatty acid--CoA ligase [Dehalococcoidia bacterium]
MQAVNDRPWFKFWPEGVPHHIDYPEIPLFRFLEDSAENYPNNVAFIHEKKSLTYRELNEQTCRLARGLNRLGVKKGDRVVLLLHNSLEFIVGYYGILKAGAIVVPLNPLYKVTELTHNFSDSGAKCVITDKECYSVIQRIEDEVRPDIVILIDGDGQPETVSLAKILVEYPTEPLKLDYHPKDDVAVITYTGGTTGLPKGVMLTHRNLVANAIQNVIWMRWSHEDTIMSVLPLYHSWGACTSMNSVIYCGARAVIMARFNAEELLKTIESEKATILYSAASLFIMLLNSSLLGKYNISSLKYVKVGAMPVSPETKERWDKTTGVTMVLGYGLSEASPETHDCPPDRVRVGTIGIPVIDTDAKIMDVETGNLELSSGEIGELVVKGPQVMKGYLNHPEDDKETLRDGWLYTGDLAFMDEEGYFHIVDRKKETIKYKGYTIAPAEIEAIIYEHPAVKECAVIGKSDTIAGEIPKAFVVLKEGCNVTGEEIMEFCERKISPYKKVREVEFISEIPKTTVGKVLRKSLKEKEESK